MYTNTQDGCPSEPEVGWCRCRCTGTPSSPLHSFGGLTPTSLAPLVLTYSSVSSPTRRPHTRSVVRRRALGGYKEKNDAGGEATPIS